MNPVKFGVFGHFPENAWREWSKILHANVHLQNWLVHGHALLVFLILALFWLSENRSNLGFPGIFRRTHGGNGLKFRILMYLDHLQNWSDYGCSLMLFWLSETGQIWGFRTFCSCSVYYPHYDEPLAEIGHIWGFWALSGERVGVNVQGAEACFRCFASNSV